MSEHNFIGSLTPRKSGRVTIPKPAREYFGLGAGDMLKLKAYDKSESTSTTYNAARRLAEDGTVSRFGTWDSASVYLIGINGERQE